MGNDEKTQQNTAWFENVNTEVDGFTPEECPHGFLRFVQKHNRTDSTYACTFCGDTFIARANEEDEE